MLRVTRTRGRPLTCGPGAAPGEHYIDPRPGVGKHGRDLHLRPFTQLRSGRRPGPGVQIRSKPETSRLDRSSLLRVAKETDRVTTLPQRLRCAQRGRKIPAAIPGGK